MTAHREQENSHIRTLDCRQAVSGFSRCTTAHNTRVINLEAHITELTDVLSPIAGSRQYDSRQQNTTDHRRKGRHSQYSG
jgi:hypothetical protein